MAWCLIKHRNNFTLYLFTFSLYFWKWWNIMPANLQFCIFEMVRSPTNRFLQYPACSIFAVPLNWNNNQSMLKIRSKEFGYLGILELYYELPASNCSSTWPLFQFQKPTSLSKTWSCNFARKHCIGNVLNSLTSTIQAWELLRWKKRWGCLMRSRDARYGDKSPKSPEIGTSSIDWAQQSRFYLTTGTESSLRNVVF
jgi:hypothetical protein